MRNRLWISLLGITLALAGSSGSAPARTSSHHRHRHVALAQPAARHGRIMGNRKTRVYYLKQTRGRLPAPANRIYFQNIADARAAGYRSERRETIPIDPRLTWRGTHRLPSLGKHREPPLPKGMQKPAAPPREQQPPVTPTQPTPN